MRAAARLVGTACLTACLGTGLVLTACSSAVSVAPAPDAADPVCARVMAAAPEEVAGGARRETTAQSALAWGDPAVVLRCGVASPGPSADCLGVETDGAVVDWIRTTGSDATTFTAYGRDPSIEVAVPAELAADPAQPLVVLNAVAPAAEVVPATQQCS